MSDFTYFIKKKKINLNSSTSHKRMKERPKRKPLEKIFLFVAIERISASKTEITQKRMNKRN
jgi:hypothetical protein